MSKNSGSDADPLDAVVESILQRCRRGERPELEEYAGRYPELAGRLRDVFPALVLIEAAGSVNDAPTRPAPPPAEPAEPPARLGDYRLLREVGRGGMGLVYEAVQESLGRHVALKVLPPAVARRGSFLERFRREARAAARLHHTNIVPVYGVGQEGGISYYAMQFIPGQGLDAVLKDVRRLRGSAAEPAGAAPASGSTGSVAVARSLLTDDFPPGPQTPSGTTALASPPPAPTENPSSLGSQPEARYYRAVARLGLQAAEALAYAHAQGVLHRDVKPSNLLLDARGNLWVTDFGLAKAEDSEDLTNTGDIVGTLRYMAPERFEGKADARSDVYALGVTLYELLTLRLPFAAADRAGLIGQINRGVPVPPRQLAPLLPRDLETVVSKAMAREPSARYAGAAALADDLRCFLENRPVKARRASAAERLRRWCRRNPAVAALTGAVLLLLLTVAVVSAVAAVSYRAQFEEAEEARRAEVRARRQAQANLWDSYLAQAEAGRMSRRPGQRFSGLRAIRKALELPVPNGRSRDELRTEAIACLLLPDLEVAKDWDGWPHGSKGFAIDPAFRRYARGDVSGNVSVRRVSDDAELFRLPGDGPIHDYFGLAFSPDGRFLIQGCETAQGRRTRLWNLDGRRPVVVLGGMNIFPAFSPDSRRLAASYPDGSIRLYNLETGREVKRYQLHRPDLTLHERAWNPRRPLLAISQGITYRLLDLDTGTARPEVVVPGGISWLDWHPDGRLLAVGGNASPHPRITLWDTRTGRLALPPLEGHKSLGVVVRFNQAGDRLLSSDWHGTWRLWDTRTGRLLLTQPAGGSWLRFSPDDGLVGIDVRHLRVRLFRFRAGQEFCTVIHRGTAAADGYGGVTNETDPGGRLVAASTRDGPVVFDVIRKEEVALLPLPGDHPLLFEPSGALWTQGKGGVLRWPVTIAARTRQRRYGPPQRVYPPTTATVSGTLDGRVLAVADYSRGALVLDRTTNRVIRLGPQTDVRSCAVSPDGRWVATGSHGATKDAGAKVWEARSGRHVRDLPVASGCWVMFSPDSKWLLTTGGGTRLWSVGTWQEGPPLGDTAQGGSAFSADGSLLAVQDVPGVVRLVLPATGKEVARLPAPEPTRLYPCCFTPDGARLVCGGNETEALYVFDLRLIRRQLAEMGLDWDAPPYPEAPPARGRKQPLEAEFVGVDLASDPAKLRRHELQSLTLRLWANPFDAGAYFKRGELSFQDQHWERASADFALAFALNPRRWQARANCVLTGFHLARWQQVRADADAVLRDHAAEVFERLRFYRAVACVKLGDPAAAAPTAADLLKLAAYATHKEGRYAATADLFLKVFRARPTWADGPPEARRSPNPAALPRYYAACSAARAGRGEGDAARLPAAEQARWRKQARVWLREEMAAMARGGDRSAVVAQLRYWKKDRWLAGLRDPKNLARLPRAEQADCRRLWAEVDDLLRRTLPKPVR